MTPRNPCNHKGRSPNGGFSLIELMIAMAVVGVFLLAVFALFTDFLLGSSEQAALSKRSADARLGLTLVRRDLRSTGFGIANKDLSDALNGTDTSVTVRSTAVHSRENAGLHGVIFDEGGGVEVHDGKGNLLDGTLEGVAMTPDRDFLEAAQLDDINTDTGNLFFVGRDGGTNTYYYERQYALGGNTDDCAPNTPDLQQTDQDTGSAVGVVECVVDFQVRYGFETDGGDVEFVSDPASPPSTAADGVPDLLKIGLMLQAGDEYRKTTSPATLSYYDPDLSGTTVDLSADQRHYRWRPVEFAVSLENME